MRVADEMMRITCFNLAIRLGGDFLVQYIR
jgi:hypothetical protein